MVPHRLRLDVSQRDPSMAASGEPTWAATLPSPDDCVDVFARELMSVSPSARPLRRVCAAQAMVQGRGRPALKRLIRKSQLLVAEQLSSFCNEGLDLPIGVPRCVIPGGLAANPDAPPTLPWTGQATELFAERMGAIRLKAADYLSTRQ